MNESYFISTDKTLLNISWVHEYLANDSYWAQGRSLEMVEQSIKHSLCFGVYKRLPDVRISQTNQQHGDSIKQCGFARLVTDYVTFGWLCDVFIDKSHRGKSLGKRLIRTIFSDEQLAPLKLSILATRDAHTLYRDHGDFRTLTESEKWMSRSSS